MYHQTDRTLNSLHQILLLNFMLVELEITTVLLFVVKNNIETLSGNRRQNQGSAHYTQVRTIHE